MGKGTLKMLDRVKGSRFLLLLSEVPWSQVAFPLLTILPVAGFYIIKPARFEWAWAGHASLVYATFFVILVWLNYYFISKEQRAKTSIAWLGVILFLAGMYLYQLLLSGEALPQLILQAGKALGLSKWWLTDNWTTSIDFIVFTVYTIGLIISFYGVKSLKYFLWPVLYIVALIFAFLLDAAYPYADFILFQWWVPGIVFIVAHLLKAFGVNVTYGKNSLTTPRSGTVVIAWPCAGIHSLLIYTAVALSFLQSLNISRVRKIIYLSIGFFGTYIVNTLRIAAIIFACYYFNADIYLMHSYLGELFFIAWIVVFLFVVVMIERRKGKTKETPSVV